MQVKPGVLVIMFLVGLLVGTMAGPGIADQDAEKKDALPRAFQSAQLGMTLSEFATVVPEAKRVSLGGRDQAERTVVVPSKDRPLQRIDYSFSNDQLREFVIHYDYAEVPGGYPGLLKKLRESYGKPLSQNLQEYYTKPEAFSQKTTVWKDRATMVNLTETRKLNGDKRELVLTITDLSPQRTSEVDHEPRKQEVTLPIPLPDNWIQNNKAAMPDVEGTPKTSLRG